MLETNRKAPWHVWVVGVLGLLWNSLGAFDYLMTKTRNESYMSNFTPEQLDYFYNFPIWADASWAVSVWCAVLGCVLLLLHKKLATPVLFLSMIAYGITWLYNVVLSNGMEIMGGGIGHVIFAAAIFVIILLLWIYARIMTARAVIT